jgi:hypothetical protein
VCEMHSLLPCCDRVVKNSSAQVLWGSALGSFAMVVWSGVNRGRSSSH